MGAAARTAAVLDVTAGAWAVLQWVALPQPCSGSVCHYLGPGFQSALGVLLLIDGLLCLVGVRQAFLAGAVLSAAIAAFAFLVWGSALDLAGVSVVVLSLVALVMDLVELGSGRALAEQGNPMNLPVFG